MADKLKDGSVKKYIDDGVVTMTNKTLTSPVINTGVSGTAIDTDVTLAANSDTLIASQKATKAYVDTLTSTLMADTGGSAFTNSTTETSIQSGVITITAGTLANGDMIKLTYTGSLPNNSGATATSTTRLKFNGTSVFGPAYAQGTGAFSPLFFHEYELTRISATQILLTGHHTISTGLNTGILNQQFVVTNVPTVSNMDSNNLTIDCTVQWATANANIGVTPSAVRAVLIKG